MHDHSTVYDLGNVDASTELPAELLRGGRATRAFRRTSTTAAGVSAGPLGVDIPGMLSLFLPGAGQIVWGDVAAGIFLLSTSGFIVALGWAVLTTLDRITATLRILELPGSAGVWSLVALYVLAAIVHVCGILTSGPGTGWRPVHPIVAGLASAVLPGWGQILGGARGRAVVFLASLWAIGATWILAAPVVESGLEAVGFYLPDVLDTICAPAVRWTVPAVIWAVAVYDAVAGGSRR